MKKTINMVQMMEELGYKQGKGMRTRTLKKVGLYQGEESNTIYITEDEAKQVLESFGTSKNATVLKSANELLGGRFRELTRTEEEKPKTAKAKKVQAGEVYNLNLTIKRLKAEIEKLKEEIADYQSAFAPEDDEPITEDDVNNFLNLM